MCGNWILPIGKVFLFTLRLVFLAMSKFSVLGIKKIWRVLILAYFQKQLMKIVSTLLLVDTLEWVLAIQYYLKLQ